MYNHERTTLARDVSVIQIPDGNRILLNEGAEVMITQGLGSSFTVMDDRGAMYLIDMKDGDAIGREVAETDATKLTEGDLESRVWEQMRQCFDPEIPVNIVDLGLVYDCQVIDLGGGGSRVEIKMTLTAPGCGMGPVIAEDVRARISDLPDVDETDVEVVLDPPWNQNMMTEAARLQLGFM